MNDDTSAYHKKSDTSNRYDTLNINSSLFDQFDNNNIIELGLTDQINKDILSHWHNMAYIESNLLN